MKTSQIRPVVGLLVLTLVFTAVTPALAQPGRRPGPPSHYGPPPPRHHHRGPSDFDKTMRIIGAVGAVAAAANGYSSYGYYRHPRPVVVVPQPRTTVIVEKQTPVVVEKVIERPVVVEREVIVEKQVPQNFPTDYYSPKLGATFMIQNMQIPGYKFRAARLTSNPVEGSPLQALKLVKGDVITRLDNDAVESLEELENHEKNTVIRYIKSGTVKVQLGKIYIPTDAEMQTPEEEIYYAP